METPNNTLSSSSRSPYTPYTTPIKSLNLESSEAENVKLTDYIKIRLYKPPELSTSLYIGFNSEHKCSVYIRRIGETMETLTYYYYQNLIFNGKHKRWFIIQILSYVADMIEILQCNAQLFRPATQTEVFCYQFPQEPKGEHKAKVLNFLNVFMHEFEDLFV